MAGEISLVFLGGIADSGKSDLRPKLEALPGVKWVNISTHFKKALEGFFLKNLGEANVALDYVEWKSKAEDTAVQLLGEEIKQLRKENGSADFNTLIVNTHFATYSPGGFMPGLDPPHIRQICQYCNLRAPNVDDENPAGKAAIILVDITISDVLQRREDRWNEKPGRSASTGPGLIQDLEFNRLYALQYYNVLSHILGSDRISYYRVLMDWRSKDMSIPVEQTRALKDAFKELKEFLERENILSS
jgi:adenylate kinase